MLRIALAVLLILTIAYFIKGFISHKRLTMKKQELEEAKEESDLLNIDKEIAHERAHQQDLQKDINTLKQGNIK